MRFSRWWRRRHWRSLSPLQFDISKLLYVKQVGARLDMDLDYVVMPALIAAVTLLFDWLCVRRIRSLRERPYRRWRKAAERVVLAIAVIMVSVVAGSSVLNAIAYQATALRHPPPGAFYTVNGARMHLNCTGAGSPTIVLDAGFGNNAMTWETVQPELSKTTRVCSYDRAGSGWSEPQPGPRDAHAIAAQLHGLLGAAKIDGPIVLMGHSIAGLYVRAYAAQYPENVAGIVFVDGSSPAQFQMPIFTAGQGSNPWNLFRDISILGLPRLMWMLELPAPGVPPHTPREEAEAQLHGHIAPLAHEMANFFRSADEVARTGPFGAVPVLIFSQDTSLGTSAEMRALAGPWNRMQEDLKALSTRSRRIIAKGSSHYVHQDRGDLIRREVPAFIEQIRGAKPSTEYGSTTTE